MKLKVLEDNNTFIDEYYLGEPAVSYYIEDNDTKILFDTGYSDAFIKNAKSMNVNLNEINKIVISHGHNDHTGGLKYLFNSISNKNIELFAHEECFDKKVFDNEYIGTSMTKDELKQVCNLRLTNTPVKISDNITFLGEIPEYIEKRDIIGKCYKNGEMINDTLKDDTAIVYKTLKGLFIITGCSHSGICNIIEYAKKVCNENKIYGVIGGFHLFDINEKLYKTIEYFKENSIKLLYPCHCCSLKAKIEMSKKLDIQEAYVGLEINI
ncbi:MAG: MBL fold metallo-hydrolase [Clostridia bacterium]|nr:MBL fold metallo-hydrolase [Clostridia bacterium]